MRATNGKVFIFVFTTQMAQAHGERLPETSFQIDRQTENCVLTKKQKGSNSLRAVPRIHRLQSSLLLSPVSQYFVTLVKAALSHLIDNFLELPSLPINTVIIARAFPLCSWSNFDLQSSILVGGVVEIIVAVFLLAVVVAIAVTVTIAIVVAGGSAGAAGPRATTATSKKATDEARPSVENITENIPGALA